MDIYLLIAFSTLLFIVFFYVKKLNMLKKYIYNISSLEEGSQTKYYIVYEQKHGVFTDTKILGKLHAFFLNKQQIETLSTLYVDEQEAINSLEQFKNEINHFSVRKK